MNIPKNGVTIQSDILQNWAAKIEERGYDAPDTEKEWLDLIIEAVKKDQEFDEYGD